MTMITTTNNKLQQKITPTINNNKQLYLIYDLFLCHFKTNLKKKQDRMQHPYQKALKVLKVFYI